MSFLCISSGEWNFFMCKMSFSQFWNTKYHRRPKLTIQGIDQTSIIYDTYRVRHNCLKCAVLCYTLGSWEYERSTKWLTSELNDVTVFDIDIEVSYSVSYRFQKISIGPSSLWHSLKSTLATALLDKRDQPDGCVAKNLCWFQKLVILRLKDVRAHCYCASLVRTPYMACRVPCHVFQARAPSRNSTKYRADDLCGNLICEYFCWMLGDPHVFFGISLPFLILSIILKNKENLYVGSFNYFSYTIQIGWNWYRDTGVCATQKLPVLRLILPELMT